MSIFSSIMSKIFGGTEAVPANTDAPAASSTATAPSVQPSSSTADAGVAGSTPVVDVEGVLTSLASKSPQQLNWRTSIVDLMKLLDLDSGLNTRKELASELHYSGDMNDSASMNIWLHKQVMQKLAENGGKVPDELKS